MRLIFGISVHIVNLVSAIVPVASVRGCTELRRIPGNDALNLAHVIARLLSNHFVVVSDLHEPSDQVHHISRRKPGHDVGSVAVSSDWSKRDKQANLFLVELRDQGATRKELGSPLEVANIRINLLGASRLENELNVRRLIVEAHIFEVEVPELLLLRRQCRMLARVDVASVVSEPNVIASSGKLESRS